MKMPVLTLKSLVGGKFLSKSGNSGTLKKVNGSLAIEWKVEPTKSDLTEFKEWLAYIIENEKS